MARPKMTITARAPSSAKSEFKLPEARSNLDAAKALEEATENKSLAEAAGKAKASEKADEPAAPKKVATKPAASKNVEPKKKSLLRNDSQAGEVTRFTVRLESEIVQDLRVHCAKNKMSLTHAVTEALEQWFANQTNS